MVESQADSDRSHNGSDSPLLPQNDFAGITQMFSSSIDKGTPQELLCQGYRRNTIKTCLSFTVTLFSAGFLQLVFYWRPDWRLKCTHTKATRKDMTAVLLTLVDTKEKFVATIQMIPQEKAMLMVRAYPNRLSQLNNGYNTLATQDLLVRAFIHHDTLYIWDESLHTFCHLRSLDKRATLEQIHQNSTAGLNEADVKNRYDLFGPNVITVRIPSNLYLLMSEILNPLYVFQLFAVIFWCFDEYYIYATAIFIISFLSAITSLIQVRRERVSLHDMVKYHNDITMKVQRQENGENLTKDVWGKELVPGDVIVIPQHGAQLACDVALVSGTCIVNESMLTGESVPITKTPLPRAESEMQNVYSADLHKRHTLFCGTEVLQTRFYPGELVKGVVVRTAYHTAKGQLVHSILYPKPVDMKLLRDAYRFIGVLFGIAVCGFIYTVVTQALKGETVKDILFNAIDLITISVPPALPLAMTIGIIYAQHRLKQQRIHCISPQRINISGQVDVVAFDKTGTLTEDGLDVATVVAVTPATDGADVASFDSEMSPENVATDLNDSMLGCMATCHTLTTIGGELAGDPLDVKMFEATGWELVEPSVADSEKYDQLHTTYVKPPKTNTGNTACVEDPDLRNIGITRQFPFSSSLQRASVIVKPMSSGPRDMVVYVKGAPETVAQMCLPTSLPSDFQKVLTKYTKQGFRMIAMATKKLTITWPKAQKIERTVVESELTFLGLMALQNKLKPESTKGLQVLHAANIRTLMVTGDNILTSLSVARESRMVQPHDEVLLASTTPPDGHQGATLTWTSSGCAKSKKQWKSNGSSTTYKFVIGEGPGKLANSPSISSEELSSDPSYVSVAMENQENWHLAVSGSDMEIIKTYFPEWVDVIATKGTVFARMSPEQKTDLMEDLEEVGYHVCMCGDGANDCGALKRAHTGISLSEYEASVAAPFTSHTELGIGCVPTLIREGRAALVTSFGMFKFMALYSIIQFCSITLLYNDVSSFSDLQFLYVDLIIIDLVAITMSRNHAHKHLYRKRPLSSLVSLEMLTSLMGQIVFQLAFQVAIFFWVKDQCWFTNLPPANVANATYNATTCPQVNNIPDQSQIENDQNVVLYQTTVVFFLSCFLYLSVSVAFSRGKPFRTSFYKNYAFVVSLLFLVACNLFLMFGAPLPLADFMQIRVIPDTMFLIWIVVFSVGHFVVSVCFEVGFVERPLVWEFLRGTRLYRACQRKENRRYVTIQRCLRDTSGHEGLTPFPFPVRDKVLVSEVFTPTPVHVKTRL
uniref:Cation-transporting ATPase n=1 Tax=Phallusia mammillata TaxID=59560 RepID=A0A6F9D7P4_9ASCI|nr:probable cation-transporting ATPase 13A3 [Phallusia mammillata]